MNCSNCGASIQPGANKCFKCGTAFAAPATAPGMQGVPVQMPLGGSGGNIADIIRFEKPYYQMEFTQMHANPAYEGKWNWAGFFFGWLWFIAKGLWINVLVWLALSILTAGAAGLGCMIVAGLRGNYIRYRKLVTQKENLW